MSEEEEDAWDPELLTMDTEEWGDESEDGARQTDLKEWSQIGGGACRTGSESWRDRRDWHMMTHSQTLMLR